MKLAVALGWHVHPWEDLLALVRRAESLGYEAVYVVTRVAGRWGIQARSSFAP